jgi:SAM-dependent methyltransferase
MDLPWQLQLYRKSLKKKEKVESILGFLEPTRGKRCLEVSCEKGVVSYFLRQRGGCWTHIDTEWGNALTTRSLIGENVLLFQEKALPFRTAAFDLIIAIDFLEHIEAEQVFLEEMERLLKPEGRLYITVPHSKKTLCLNRLAPKWGLTPEYYGHKREGYTLEELRDKLRQAGFEITRSREYSRFFTELVELLANLAYVFALNRGVKKKGIKGSISPASQEDFFAHSRSFRFYRFIYPFFWLVSQMDRLRPSGSGYVLITEAKKEPGKEPKP